MMRLAILRFSRALGDTKIYVPLTHIRAIQIWYGIYPVLKTQRYTPKTDPVPSHLSTHTRKRYTSSAV